MQANKRLARVLSCRVKFDAFASLFGRDKKTIGRALITTKFSRLDAGLDAWDASL